MMERNRYQNRKRTGEFTDLSKEKTHINSEGVRGEAGRYEKQMKMKTQQTQAGMRPKQCQRETQSSKLTPQGTRKRKCKWNPEPAAHSKHRLELKPGKTSLGNHGNGDPHWPRFNPTKGKGVLKH